MQFKDWFGKDTFEDTTFKKMLQITQQTKEKYPEFNFKQCICYDQQIETVMKKDRLENIRYLWQTHVKPDMQNSNPTYLWEWNEKKQRKCPVLFFFTNKPTNFKQFHEDIDSVLPDTLSWFLIVKEIPLRQLQYVDSVYPWVQVDPTDSSNWRGPGNYIDWFYRTTVNHDTIPFVTGAVWPGFNDTCIVELSWPKHGYLSRLNGLTYDSTWYLIHNFDSLYSKGSYLKASWVQIETMNDFNEGTEIEPSYEYCFHNLLNTYRHICRFKGLPARNDNSMFVAGEQIYQGHRLIESGVRDSSIFNFRLENAISAYFSQNFPLAKKEAEYIITKVDPDANKERNLLTRFVLHQNYPNPFNSSTKIQFALPEARDVKIQIFNTGGELVNTLANQKFPVGIHSLTWQGLDNRGKQVSTGIYFYKFRAGKFVRVKKLAFVK